MEEDYLNKLRSIYQAVTSTPRLKYYGWKEISGRLGDVQKPGFSFFGKKMAFVFACLIIVFLGGFSFYTSVKASMPGTLLYPVKILSEDIVVKVTNDNQIKVDNRAQEIVNLVEKRSEDTKALQKVSSEYSNEVNNILKKEVDSQEKQHLEDHLQEDHKKFDEVVERHPEVKEDIKDAINASGGEEHSSESED